MRTPGNEMAWNHWHSAVKKELAKFKLLETLAIALELEELYDEGYTPHDAAKAVYVSRT